MFLENPAIYETIPGLYFCRFNTKTYKNKMKDSSVKKVMAVILGVSVVVLIIWNVMKGDLIIIGLRN